VSREIGPVRIGNCSGFYGDRHSAMREMLIGGELDYVTGDYLAELTMLILARDRAKSPDRGYAKTFLTQLEECLGTALDKGVRIVANAGGLNPAGLAAAVRALADRLGLDAKVAHVEGDDLIGRAAELGFGTPPALGVPPLAGESEATGGTILSANAYLGAWGIVDCLNAGADVVVTGRVTDASVIVGPAAAHFGWNRTDYDALAGAVAAGHVIECGVQATGGNYAFFTEVPDLLNTGFPIAEIDADGSSVITKHPGTGGLVSVDTVTAQLLYEISGARYANPDVTLRVDSLALSDEGPDRVRISGVRGEPPPPTLKVSLNAIGGFRNATTFVLTGLDIDAKADLVKRRHRGSGQRVAALRGPRPRSGERRAPLLLRRSRIGIGELPGVHVNRTAGRRPGVRGVHPWLRRRDRGTARRRARRRHAHRHPRRHRDQGAGTGRTVRTARTDAVRRDPACAFGFRRRRPQRRQGRQRQRRGVGAHR
jgi:hypothetical protein